MLHTLKLTVRLTTSRFPCVLAVFTDQFELGPRVEIQQMAKVPELSAAPWCVSAEGDRLLKPLATFRPG